MTNNIEQIEELLYEYGQEERNAGNSGLFRDAVRAAGYRRKIIDIVKSMQSQIDALQQEADADESRESESL